MKFNIAYPQTGLQKLIEIEDERRLRSVYDKRISHEVEGEVLGDEFKGYVMKISGGNDQQGFPMKQGVLVNTRVRLLLDKNHSCYRPRRRGERKRKSVRGCIVGPDLAVLNLVVIKKGEGEIPGLTDSEAPRRLGPKRASKIAKLFGLTKDDDVRQYVVRREIVKGDKKYSKAPKIQRLITPQRIQRKRKEKSLKRERYTKSREEAKEYNALLAKIHKEEAAAKQQAKSRRRSESKRESSKRV